MCLESNTLNILAVIRITSYNVCYTKLLRLLPVALLRGMGAGCATLIAGGCAGRGRNKAGPAGPSPSQKGSTKHSGIRGRKLVTVQDSRSAC